MGHPVHLMLVHFPSALFPLHFVMGLLPFCGIDDFVTVLPYLLMIAVASGWLASLAGVSEILRLEKANRQRMLKQALVHGGINFSALLVYSVLLAMVWSENENNGSILLIIEGIALLSIIVGNFYGAKILERYVDF